MTNNDQAKHLCIYPPPPIARLHLGHTERGQPPLNTPVEDIIILEPFSNEEVSAELAKVRVVRLVVEAECSGVVQENAKLIGESTAEKIGGSRHLLFHDTVILLLLCRSLQALPWEWSMKKIHQDVSKGLEIIPASLLHT